MDSDKQPSLSSKATWSQNFTDFAIVVESGEELKCHKHVLASNSEFFRTLLNTDLEETKTFQVKIEHSNEETLLSFLEYLYSEPLHSAKGLEQIKKKLDPNKYIFKRSFEEKKLTPELLCMAHMYRVKDLWMDCTGHLKASVCDNNVIDIWMAAEMCENQELSKVAFDHLVERPRGKTFEDVPGFNKAFPDPFH